MPLRPASGAVGALYSFGNAGKGVIQSPGLNTTDVSIVRSFAVKEEVKVQFRGEFFNAFNRTEFANPGTSQGTAQFGVISGISNSANPARQVQLALKLIF